MRNLEDGIALTRVWNSQRQTDRPLTLQSKLARGPPSLKKSSRENSLTVAGNEGPPARVGRLSLFRVSAMCSCLPWRVRGHGRSQKSRRFYATWRFQEWFSDSRKTLNFLTRFQSSATLSCGMNLSFRGAPY